MNASRRHHRGTGAGRPRVRTGRSQTAVGGTAATSAGIRIERPCGRSARKVPAPGGRAGSRPARQPPAAAMGRTGPTGPGSVPPTRAARRPTLASATAIETGRAPARAGTERPRTPGSAARPADRRPTTGPRADLGPARCRALLARVDPARPSGGPAGPRRPAVRPPARDRADRQAARARGSRPSRQSRRIAARAVDQPTRCSATTRSSSPGGARSRRRSRRVAQSGGCSSCPSGAPRSTQLVLHATTLRIPVVEVEGGTLTALCGFDGHQGVALVVEPRRWATLDDVSRAPASAAERAVRAGPRLARGSAERGHAAPHRRGRRRPRRALPDPPLGAPQRRPRSRPRRAPSSTSCWCRSTTSPGALADLHGRGLRIVGADEWRTADLSRGGPARAAGVVVGSEGQGIGPAIRRRLDLDGAHPDARRSRVAQRRAWPGSVPARSKASRAARSLAATDGATPADEDARHGPDVDPASDAGPTPSSADEPRALRRPHRRALRVLGRGTVTSTVRADVAQLVEQRFCKPPVPGSSPVVGSK